MKSFILFVPLADKRPVEQIVAQALKNKDLFWADVESYKSGYDVSLVEGRAISDFEQGQYRIVVNLRHTAEQCPD